MKCPSRDLKPARARAGSLLGFLLPALLLLALPGCRAADAEPAAEKATSAVAETVALPRVTAVEVVPRVLPLMVEATGRVEAWREVVVYSEAGGVIVDLPAIEGRRVAKGAVLLALDETDAQLDVAEMEAEWLRTQASYAVSYAQDSSEERGAAAGESFTVGGVKSDGVKSDGVKSDELERKLQEGLISRQEYLRKKRDLDASGLLKGGRQDEVRAATAGLLQSEQRLARARLALEKKRLSAPLAGLVADVAVELGQRINAGEAVLTLIEDRRLKVQVDVLEADLFKARVGARAEVEIPAAGMRLSGSIFSINPKIDPATSTGRVTVAIDNPNGDLVVGLFAKVSIELESLKERLAVPAVAILQRQGRNLVFRIDQGRALWTWVELGARSGDWVEIRQGLAAGDLVATANHFALGHETRVEMVSTAGAEALPRASAP